MRDIAIIGGGPGGLYAAQHLARRGLNVVVLEEHAASGDPVHCTGVLAAEAFDEFRVSRDSVLNALTAFTFFGPAGTVIEYSTPKPEALVIDRREFDAMLCRRAVAAGVDVRLGVRASDVKVEADGVLVVSDETPLRARACVLACGANYALQRRLGLGLPSLHLQSAQLEVPVQNPGNVEVHLGSEVAPKGFAWVVPVYRRSQAFARIGLMCTHDVRDHFDRFIARVGPRWQPGVSGCFSAGMTPRIKVLPLGPISRTYADRILAVGDAAGLVKATTGGGIYYSLLSGRLAAQVLAASFASGDFSAAALSEYERRWRHALEAELDAQMTLRRLASRLSDEEIDGLFDLARTDGIMPIVRRTARFNRHRELIISLLNHPPVRRLLRRRVLGRSRPAVFQPV